MLILLKNFRFKKAGAEVAVLGVKSIGSSNLLKPESKLRNNRNVYTYMNVNYKLTFKKLDSEQQ